MDTFRAFLHRRSLRFTGVRSEIMRAILDRKGHFDIGELVESLRARGVDASRATVYRTLPLLREAGIVQETSPSQERRRYEAAAGHEHHDHLICTCCGLIVEFHFEAFEVLQSEVADKYGFRLTGHLHQLSGLCRKCRASEGRRGRAGGGATAAQFLLES